MTALQQILAIFSGLMVGFSLGLIGGGGSILAVPLLLYLVGYHDPHIVIGTTALAVAMTAYINLLPHWRAGNVRWKEGIAFALPGVLGALIGAHLGKVFPGEDLLFLFALLMIVVAVFMVRPRGTSNEKTMSNSAMLQRVIPTSFAVGALSGFFGIGGGFLIVPGLVFATGMPMIAAVGTSLLSVGTFGTATAITYALSHLVNWSIALEYILGGFLGGLGGSRLATVLGKQKQMLTYVFAAVILVVAIYMLYVNAQALHVLGM